MAHLYINFAKNSPLTPWFLTETNADRTEMISQKLASDLEINVPCKTFVGKFHYFYCEGTVTWNDTKAIIN